MAGRWLALRALQSHTRQRVVAAIPPADFARGRLRPKKVDSDIHSHRQLQATSPTQAATTLTTTFALRRGRRSAALRPKKVNSCIHSTTPAHTDPTSHHSHDPQAATT